MLQHRITPLLVLAAVWSGAASADPGADPDSVFGDAGRIRAAAPADAGGAGSVTAAAAGSAFPPPAAVPPAAVPPAPVPAPGSAAPAPVAAAAPAAAVPAQDAGAAGVEGAFRDAIPLNPAAIRELGRRYRAVEAAQEESGLETAMPANRPAINVSFAPGQQTSLIATARGYPTAVSFFDSTGEPWPIAWDTGSNASTGGGKGGNSCATSGHEGGQNGFFVCVPVNGGNTIEITPLSARPRGGLLVSLKGAPKPISFVVVSGRGYYDANLTVRVGEHGPNARIVTDTRPGAPPTGEPYMNAMLSGIAPASATPLSVEGVSPDDVRGWRIGNEMYLRTRHTMMSPAWDDTEVGEGGYAIYAVPATPVALLSVNGRTVSVGLKDATP